MEEPELRYELYADQPLSEDDVAALLRRITVYLSLDDDLRQLYGLIDSDPPFVAVKRELYGYHQVKFLTPFENTCWTILSQRNLLQIAQRMKRVLIKEFSAGVEVAGMQFWPFPGAKIVVQASLEDLTRLLRNSRRAEYVLGAAAAFCEVDDRFLREGPYDEVFRWLCGIPGVGDWSAALIMIRSLGRMERIPYGDKSLRTHRGADLRRRPAGDARGAAAARRPLRRPAGLLGPLHARDRPARPIPVDGRDDPRGARGAGARRRPVVAW